MEKQEENFGQFTEDTPKLSGISSLNSSKSTIFSSENAQLCLNFTQSSSSSETTLPYQNFPPLCSQKKESKVSDIQIIGRKIRRIEIIPTVNGIGFGSTNSSIKNEEKVSISNPELQTFEFPQQQQQQSLQYQQLIVNSQQSLVKLENEFFKQQQSQQQQFDLILNDNYKCVQLGTDLLQQGPLMPQNQNHQINSFQQDSSDGIQQNGKQQKGKIQMMEYSADNIWLNSYLEYPMIVQLFSSHSFNGNFVDFFQNLFGKYHSEEIIKVPLMTQHYSNQSKVNKKETSALSSKFHNKNKLFMNTIIRFFTLENLNKIVMPPILEHHIFNILQACKNSGIQYGKKRKIEKTDKFNHSHYRLLFLTLNPESIQKIKKYEQDMTLHKQIFNLDLYKYDHKNALLNDYDIENKILFVNFLKRCIYEIVMRYIYRDFIGEPEQWEEERLYECRAFQGIAQLIEGNCIMRF